VDDRSTWWREHEASQIRSRSSAPYSGKLPSHSRRRRAPSVPPALRCAHVIRRRVWSPFAERPGVGTRRCRAAWGRFRSPSPSLPLSSGYGRRLLLCWGRLSAIALGPCPLPRARPARSRMSRRALPSARRPPSPHRLRPSPRPVTGCIAPYASVRPSSLVQPRREARAAICDVASPGTCRASRATIPLVQELVAGCMHFAMLACHCCLPWVSAPSRAYVRSRKSQNQLHLRASDPYKLALTTTTR
jgi:hypothetical protein